MIKCIIVDDEPLAQQILKRYISQTPDLDLLKACGNATEAFDMIHREAVDLIFLDIKMPGLSGIDFIRSLKTPPTFIFTTAFSEYASVSYELNAVDYLLKPITYERFKLSLSKFSKLQMPPEPAVSYSYFKVNGKMVKIEHADIIYAQSIKDYIIIHTAGGRYVTHMTMKYLAQLLASASFVRVHRSFLIGLLHVTSFGRTEIALGEVKIPVGEKYKHTLHANH